jgi:catechol 2,3-dioxygenase-like lactoylglutathione lyase family enzyme
MVADVDAAVDFYTTHLGFTVRMSATPAFADVTRGRLRLLDCPGTSSSYSNPPANGGRFTHKRTTAGFLFTEGA